MSKSWLTKSARHALDNQNTGTGIIAIKTGPNTITEIEFYTDQAGVMRRVANGLPLFPIECFDEGNFFAAGSPTSETANRFSLINRGICPECRGKLSEAGVCDPCHIVPALDPDFQRWVHSTRQS